EFYQRFAAETDDDPSARLEQARAYKRTGDIQQKLGQYAAAAAAYTAATDRLNRLRVADPKAADVRSELAACLNSRGALRLAASAPADGIDLFRQSIQLMTELVAEHPQEADYRLGLYKPLSNLATAHLELTRFDDARRGYADAREQFRQYKVLKR